MNVEASGDDNANNSTSWPRYGPLWSKKDFK